MIAISPVGLPSADNSATVFASIEAYLATYYRDKVPVQKPDNDDNPRHLFRRTCQTLQGRYAVFPGNGFVSYCRLTSVAP